MTGLPTDLRQEILSDGQFRKEKDERLVRGDH